MMDVFGEKWCVNFGVGEHEVRVFGNLNAKEPTPVVYLNTIADEGYAIWQACLKAELPPFVLVEITVPAWHDDMTPWPGPALTPRGEPFGGAADAYIPLLTGTIVPKVERMLSFTPKWRGLVGYSLAGLFALYTLYRTDIFDRIGSISGSLWYWDFVEYISEHEAKRTADCVYLSLGDKEGQTKDETLNSVEPYTGRCYVRLNNRGHKTYFERNEGNHFHEPEARVVKGIGFLLTH